MRWDVIKTRPDVTASISFNINTNVSVSVPVGSANEHNWDLATAIVCRFL
jgi:hypothetical protein